MNKKFFGILLIAVVFVFPFRIAFLEQSSSNVVNILSFLATAFGFLIFMLMSNTDAKTEEQLEDKKAEAHKQNYKQAA